MGALWRIGVGDARKQKGRNDAASQLSGGRGTDRRTTILASCVFRDRRPWITSCSAAYSVGSLEVWDRILSPLGLTTLVAHGDVDIFLWWSWSRRRAAL